MREKEWEVARLTTRQADKERTKRSPEKVRSSERF